MWRNVEFSRTLLKIQVTFGDYIIINIRWYDFITNLDN